QEGLVDVWAFRRLTALPRGPATRAALVRELDVPPTVLRHLAARDPQQYPLLLDSAAAGPLSHTSLLLAAPSAALWLDRTGRLGSQGVAAGGSGFPAALED